jgi:hypothetical protein
MTTAAAVKNHRLPAQHHSKAQDVAAGVISIVLWMAASSALIIYNKALYDNGFPFPQMVTGMGQVLGGSGSTCVCHVCQPASCIMHASIMHASHQSVIHRSASSSLKH